MLVELKKLKPNSLRNFSVDPIDQDVVETLRKSIKEDGFWGGVVCRHNGNGLEIACGQHRIEAAMKAGIKEADVFVAKDLDDVGMLRIYARENATQRGNSSTAQTGSVASAIKIIAKMALTGVSREFTGNYDWPKIAGNLASDRGIGADIILRFLKDIPGVNDNSIKQALINLKASKDYGQIIAQVQAEILEEEKERLEALERAEREHQQAEENARKAETERKEAAVRAKTAREEAEKKKLELERKTAEEDAKLAEKRRKEAEEAMEQFRSLKKKRDDAEKAAKASSKKTPTFDFEGVAKHFKNSHQIDVFRTIVTGRGIAPYLPVDQQAALAEALVTLAKKQDHELSSAFIKANIISLVLTAKHKSREHGKHEREELERQNWEMKADRLQDDFARNCRGMITAGLALQKLQKEWPKEFKFLVRGDFLRALHGAKDVIDRLVVGNSQQSQSKKKQIQVQ